MVTRTKISPNADIFIQFKELRHECQQNNNNVGIHCSQFDFSDVITNHVGYMDNNSVVSLLVHTIYPTHDVNITIRAASKPFTISDINFSSQVQLVGLIASCEIILLRSVLLSSFFKNKLKASGKGSFYSKSTREPAALFKSRFLI